MVQTAEQINDQLEVIETTTDSREEETTDQRVVIETTEDDVYHAIALLFHEFKLELLRLVLL